MGGGGAEEGTKEHLLTKMLASLSLVPWWQ